MHAAVIGFESNHEAGNRYVAYLRVREAERERERKC